MAEVDAVAASARSSEAAAVVEPGTASDTSVCMHSLLLELRRSGSG